MKNSDNPTSQEDIEVLKLHLMQGMKDEVVRWLKSRFSIVAALFTIVAAFGLKAVLDDVIVDLVEKNVKLSIEQSQKQAEVSINFHIGQLENAVNEANIKKQELIKATENAQKVAEDTQEFIAETRTKLGVIRSEIDNSTEQARKIIKELNELREVYGEFGKEVFEKVTKIGKKFERSVLMSNFYNERLENIELTIKNMLDKLDFYSKDEIYKPVNIQYNSNHGRISNKHTSLIEEFDDNSKYKVILYVKRDQDFIAKAEMVADDIMKFGFEAEVWVANSDNKEEAIENISADFPGIGERISEYKDGALVYWENSKTKSDRIETILENHDDYNGMPEFITDFEVEEALRKKLDGSIVPASETLLIYKTE